jgi:hypothetical protein
MKICGDINTDDEKNSYGFFSIPIFIIYNIVWFISFGFFSFYLFVLYFGNGSFHNSNECIVYFFFKLFK